MSDLTRRDFIGTAAAAAVVAGTSSTLAGDGTSGGVTASRPVVIASGNGLRATEKAMALIPWMR